MNYDKINVNYRISYENFYQNNSKNNWYTNNLNIKKKTEIFIGCLLIDKDLRFVMHDDNRVYIFFIYIAGKRSVSSTFQFDVVNRF